MVRQDRSKPLVAALKIWLERQLARVSAKAPIAEDIRYGLNHWDGLVRFLDDGRIELDTNIVERGIRPIVLNRKNALFAGHDEGAANWACIASLIECCKLNDVDPQAYFADVLAKLVNLWPACRIDDSCPGPRAPPIGSPSRKSRCVMIDPIAVGSNFQASSPTALKTTATPSKLDDFSNP